MAFLSSLVLFCLCCFASDVVELEPVQSTTYNCDNTSLANAVSCNPVAYCHWRSTDNKCIDDPCLLIIDPSINTCAISDNVQCAPSTLPSTNQDCVGGGGKFCRSPDATLSNYDYCFWAQLRDGSCPSTICKLADKKCVSNSGTSGCQMLNSEADCKMVPKCMWYSGSCMQDPCFFGSEAKSCGTWTNGGATKPGGGGTLAEGDCVQYQPYKPDGSIINYCVHKDNSKPNLCYFINGDSDSTSATDYSATYPTYRGGNTPTCTGTISGCDDNPSGLCTTKINTKGGLAGLYCGDKDHGAASVLHIPSLVVFLLASIFVSKFTL